MARRPIQINKLLQAMVLFKPRPKKFIADGGEQELSAAWVMWQKPNPDGLLHKLIVPHGCVDNLQAGEYFGGPVLLTYKGDKSSHVCRLVEIKKLDNQPASVVVVQDWKRYEAVFQ